MVIRHHLPRANLASKSRYFPCTKGTRPAFARNAAPTGKIRCSVLTTSGLLRVGHRVFRTVAETTTQR
jgi:hypothetical protein